jgi:hypothetical protein
MRMMNAKPATVFVAGIFVATLVCPARAQQLEKAAPAAAAPMRVEGAAPVIDGSLTDPAWQRAPLLEGFRQHEPAEGQPASERTEVRVLYDDRALYIAAWLFDSDPSGIVVGENRRDSNLRDTDAFQIVLDTYRDQQNAFVFGTTPAGTQYDGQISLEGGSSEGSNAQRQQRQQAGSGVGLNVNWDGEWTVQTARDSAGWYAEFRIPFSTLRFGNTRQQTWGANFARNIRRRNEEDFWSPVPRPYTLYRLQEAGTLQSLEVPSQRVVAVTPYALASARHDFAGGLDRDYPMEVGGDAKISLTSGLTLDLTVNTDFAQVEVDEEQVNLTRFNTFFPEKRPFFLENAGFFAVGTPQAVELFSSRRIGIGNNGALIPILAGGRVTGQAGAFKVGVLDIQTDDSPVQTANNYAVARVSLPLPNRSRIGLIGTNRQATGGDGSGDWNRSYGADGRLGIGEAINFDAYAGRTSTPGRNGRDHAASLRGEYLTRKWNIQAQYTEVGADFNPEVGFLGRNDYRYIQQQTYRYFRNEKLTWLRQFEPHYTYRGYFDFEGDRVSGQMHLDPTIRFANGGTFSPVSNFVWEGLKQPFTTVGGVVVAPGLYQKWAFEWHLASNPSAPASVDARVNFGGYLSGNRRGTTMQVTARPGASLTVVTRFSYDDIRLREGEFIAKLLSTRIGYTFTPTTFVQALVQYTNLPRRVWSANLRFGWLNTDGTGLFIVLNDQEVTDQLAVNRTYRPAYRGVTVKYTRRFDLFR